MTMGRYGRPLLQTIVTLAGTRSCLLVYLSLFALLWSETPSSAQRTELAQKLELCPLHFIEVVLFHELDSPHQLHIVRYSGH